MTIQEIKQTIFKVTTNIISEQQITNAHQLRNKVLDHYDPNMEWRLDERIQFVSDAVQTILDSDEAIQNM